MVEQASIPTQNKVLTGAPSIKMVRQLSNSNNSDDEGITEPSAIISKKQQDFISFPLIADPEVPNNKSFSGLISKTLRKVTNNATKLVENYSGTSHDLSTPKHIESSESITSIAHGDQHLTSIAHGNQHLSSVGSRPVANETDSRILPSSIAHIDKSDENFLQDPVSNIQTDKDVTINQRHMVNDATANQRQMVNDATINQRQMVNEATINQRQMAKEEQSRPKAQPSQAQSLSQLAKLTQKSGLHHIPESIQSSSSLSTTNKVHKVSKEVSGSKVTSDNKSLRLSNLQFPKSQSINPSATSSVVNINASATVDVPESSASNNTSISSSKNRDQGRAQQDLDSKTKKPSLKKKISTMFNNLPNDIEFSEDSASDSDTMDDIVENELPVVVQKGASATTASATTASATTTTTTAAAAATATATATTTATATIAPNSSNGTTTPPSKTNTKTQFQYDFGSRYSGSIAKSSPVKAEIKNKATFTTKTVGQSPTLSSFQALQEKNHNASKKKSSNFSSIILDNAKTIINQNIGAVASSTSSIVGKKKKKKPKRVSENPLKNGGIPRKYWMNDDFVVDCLNCFKPFTAFRRKHHCRFCGQIFCSDCMLFVSYTQHRDERNNITQNKKPYNDKLRVCKPCYSDVIIYLSDASSGSETEEEGELATEELQTPEKKSGDHLIPNNPLMRVRSLSLSSLYRGSLQGDDINKSGSQNGASNETSSMKDGSSPWHGHFIYPDESIKSNPKQAPRMAIPTTRAGESVEIPIVRNSFTNSSILRNFNKNSTSNYKIEALSSRNTTQHPHMNLVTPATQHSLLQRQYHSHQYPHASFETPVSSKTWLKAAQGTNNTGIFMSRSFDNASTLYSNFITRKPSFKQKLHSETRNPDAMNCSYEENDGHHTDTESTDSASEEELNGIENGLSETNSEEEDNNAMSLYASLNDSYKYGSTPLAQNNYIYGSSTTSVPTLGEFPALKSFLGDKLELNQPVSNNANTPNVLFADTQRRPENIRSRARANASLQRMKSRRQSRATRNVSILTHNNIRLPSMESPNHRSHFTSQLVPVSSSSSPPQPPALSPPQPPPQPPPPPLTTFALPENTIRSNLTSTISHADTYSDSNSSLSNQNGTEISQIETGMSTSTVLEPRSNNIDYFTYDSSQSPVREGMNLESNFSKFDRPELYKKHLKDVLKQSLDDCDVIDHQDKWMSVLNRVLSNVNLIKLTDTLDIRQYVKIKRILGGKIEQTSIIEGLFMTKDVDSKRMSTVIENPRIALLMFPVEYLKQREQFISLRIIHAQQSVYITNLVSRIISLEPDIIVVGDTVCGLAEKLLEEAGITAISNVKPQVIERISRYTNADIFQSVNDLFFKKGNLGRCAKFEVKRYKYQNIVKTFTFFSGTNIQSGFSICLRGGDEELLGSIKYTAETLTPGYLNARYEKSFFGNMLLCFDFDNLNKCENLVMVNDILDELQNSEYWGKIEPGLDSGEEVIKYIDLFNTRKLSLSPCVQFSLPTPLVNLVVSYRNYFQSFVRDKSLQELADVGTVDSSIMENLNITVTSADLPRKDKDLLEILKCTSAHQLKLALTELQTRARIWSNCVKYTSYQLIPIFHRNIYFLHSTISIKHATPCSGPNIVVVDYYTDNDKCLGLFLDQTINDSSRVCDECGELLFDHYKTYVHGNAKIDFITEEYDIKLSDNGDGNGITTQGKNQRIMWSYCKECNYVTPIMAMSDETYYLSIGKFFELNFYGQNVKGGCEHDYFKNYVKCFGFNDLIIRIEYSKIDNYEIVVPKKQLQFIVDIDIKLKLEAFKSIKSKAQAFFDSILNRLNRVKLDTFVKAEDGTKEISELKKKVSIDSQMIYNKLQQKYEDISVTSFLELNSIYRDLQKLGVIWDNEFNDFEKKYLPNESEVNKITQFHLRKFLMDKHSDKAVDETELPKGDGDDKRLEKVDFQQPAKDTATPNHSSLPVSEQAIPRSQTSANAATTITLEKSKTLKDDDESGGKMNWNGNRNELDSTRLLPEFVPRKPKEVQDDRRPSDPNLEFKMFPANSLYGQTSNISERISKWEQTASETSTMKPNEIDLTRMASDSSLNTVIPSQNKVIHLANFFDKMYYDQISLEFSKQREFEMKKRSRIKAQPILDSKPIVKIYNKIEDVVGDSELDEKKKNTESESEAKSKSKQDDGKDKEEQPSQPKQVDIPEKQSLLKSLTNFWADRSATLWEPLAYPLESHEHTFADSDVIVREDEPSSLVAFCLSSNDYTQKMKSLYEQGEVDPSESKDDLRPKKSTIIDYSKSQEPQSEVVVAADGNHLGSSQHQHSIEEQNEEGLEDNDNRDVNVETSSKENSSDNLNRYKDFGFGLNSNDKKKHIQFAKIEKKFKQKNPQTFGKESHLEAVLNKKESNHLKYQFSDGNTNLSCKIFYSEQFQALRRLCGVQDSFIQSLSRCVKWQSNGGKSGSSFLKTLDNRYIVKELSKSELESFVSIAPFYFKYIGQSMFYTLTTAIAKIFGFYQVEIKNNTTGKLFKMDFLIMENLFYNHKTTRIFDLKGSMRNRHVQQTGKENEVLLDENMIEYIYESPVFVKEQSKKLLRGCLFNDTSFLSAMDVMDYSLVIGIDDTTKKLYIGIIDWLRTFTWDKKVENWVKGNNLIGGGKKGKDPTIVTPKQYRIRFREAMERYILEVPDIWYEGSK
ncbi:hypothetical protein KGF56_002812 [Candida oxycetoniae]|uniref:1-phosphatidylinositol-3-phosphate 5-kinase n=1 Tax=Candida oxycetoniae TaxID=497107 RepID=A0AAI9SXJ6_9ASCO|nr:uncharacterized protein KGF56_002812 [Candida oxycetoniae]KAI3404415.2 hypothetical protein KGF56_002812 [Candida oxycetoniae]